ncbi:hypothetical protein F4805DRAFT_112725 [Annulohypoxylon moriforme]|nr:hypothetical protein F4805DRAFT_112725 [Annulohypoxylon moriforme]
MSRRWDIHDFDDPDENPITRFRHLGGDYGPYDPAFGWTGDFDDFDDFDDSEDDSEYGSDDSFSGMPSAIEEFCTDEKFPPNPKDIVRRTPAGPMSALYDTRYFVPQWDEQMLGPPWKQERANWDFDNPPKPPPLTDPQMQGVFKYCEHCELTWLVGHSKVEGHHHPHHLAWDMGDEALNIHRYGMALESSIVVFVHGASLPAGKKSKSPAGNLASVGIFFGEGSKYNQAIPCGKISTPQDSEMAELTAVKATLAITDTYIRKDRKKLLMEFAVKKHEARLKAKRERAKLLESGKSASTGQIEIIDDDDDELEDYASHKHDPFDKLDSRVIIVSDKIQVVDNVCKHSKVWKEDKGQLFSKKGKPIKNGELYKDLIFSELEDEMGVFVKWYHVPRDQNKGAVNLAMDALEGKFLSMGDRGQWVPGVDE